MSKEFPCPYCSKEFDTAWALKNHVRISSGEHGPKYSTPEGFKPEKKSNPGPPSPNVSEPNVSETQDSNISQTFKDGDLQTVQKVEPPEEKPVTKWECPSCGAGKEDWISIDEAIKKDLYNISDEDKKEYDFVCTNCDEAIKVREGELST